MMFGDHRTGRGVRAALFALLLGTPACVNTTAERGVDPLWHGVPEDSFERGRTTRAEVLAALGPPSQILTLKSETAFYYLLETVRAKGLVLIVYNDRTETASYERAVFFFDDAGLLTDYSLSAPAE